MESTIEKRKASPDASAQGSDVPGDYSVSTDLFWVVGVTDRGIELWVRGLFVQTPDLVNTLQVLMFRMLAVSRSIPRCSA